ncbi:MAG TPA: tRNA (guanosine(37)-N1)-methyltransferase TrmD, partial [Polyangiaceae bacterium]|nr:tRNA (guanosine(37)-N1)-methyltransferase TrmD [Polyangiaceae bacterium]
AVVTLFPELFTPFLELAFVGRAIASGALRVHLEAMRKHGLGKHLSVDDTPYGGGSGMLMRPDTTVAAIEAAELALAAKERPRRILLTPQGARFTQARARELASTPSLILICGRYEGFDERVRHFVDEELSLGDFVLTGGEVAAMCVIEACIRLLPGVLGNAQSTSEESFSGECAGLLEYPQYTRPVGFRELEVPEVLRSGDHEKVRAWRAAASAERTRERRPDLLKIPAKAGSEGEP